VAGFPLYDGLMHSVGRRAATIGALLLVVGCGGVEPPPTAPAREAAPGPVEDLAARLILIGDAGDPAPRDPVLVALRREIERDPSRTLVVFLGDNIYPRGLSALGTRRHEEELSRLELQLEAVRGTPATTVFIPGNHDWDNGGEDGWEAIRRQAEYVDRHGGPGVSWLPPDGCPGPEPLDFGGAVRLVVLDTQWWLHDGRRPEDPDSSCAADSEAEVLEALARDMAGAGERPVVVVGHHPLATGGPHGGHFGWREHLFPLRAAQSWLWLPLPIIGSAYPIARQHGITDQDLSGSRNRHLRESLAEVFAELPPRVFAAGHEHTLQVLEGREVPWLLVSGAGYYGHSSPVGRLPETLFASSASGFMRLDLDASGAVRLGVLVVDASGESREAFARLLP